MPTVEEDPNDATAITGFRHLVNLFRPFNDVFVGLWNKARHDCSTAWLAQLQQQLTDALPEYLDTTESQAADLRTSQQWLRTMIWQLSITNGYLSSGSSDASMTFTYPIQIARDLTSDTMRFSQQSMEVHGVGLVRLPRAFQDYQITVSGRETFRYSLHPNGCYGLRAAGARRI